MKRKKGVFEKEFDDLEKGFERDIVSAEKWVYARRKFLIKLAFVFALILFLFIVSMILGP